MLINNCSDRLLTDIVPNHVYLRGTGKIVSVVVFFFTNKVVARASHACRINAGSNKDYLFSSRFESIEICFRLSAHSSECCSFTASDYGDGKRHLLHPPGQGSEPAGTPTSPPSTTSSCSLSTGQRCWSHSFRSNSHSQNHLWLTKKCFGSRALPLGAERLLLLRVYLSLSDLIMYPWWAQTVAEEGVKTLQRTIMELVRSNAASTQAPFKIENATTAIRCEVTRSDKLSLPLAGWQESSALF